MSTLRRHLYILIIPTMLIGAIAILLSSYFISLRGFRAIEDEEAVQRTSKVAQGVAAELEALDAAVLDYSAWDDTCAFVAGTRPDYPASNLVDSLYEGFDLNLVVILDQAGQVVWGEAFCLESGERMPFPAALREHLLPGSPLLSHHHPTSSVTGSLALGSESWLVASRPIVTGNEEGPIRGTVVMGRLITESYLAELSERLGQTLIVEGVGTASPDMRSVDADSTDIATGTTMEEDVIRGRVAVSDIYADSSLLLRFDAPRLIYGQGLRTATAQAHTLVAIIVLLVATLIAILEQSIFRPLSRLAQAVRALRTGALNHLSTDHKQCKELDLVAEEINDLVKQLEASKDRLRDRYQEAKTLADQDPLTGLLNHRALFERLEQALHRARQQAEPLSLVLMDIDDFKHINDSFGHLKGDKILRVAAGIIESCGRKNDVLGRYGGDEFVALLPGTTQEEAVRFARRILASMADESRTRNLGLPEGIPLLLSCGVASYPECGQDVNELVAYADANLYRAKAAGGGMVTEKSFSQEAEETRGGTFAILEGLIAAINNKDRYTRRHSEEVAAHAVRMAEALGLSDEEQRSIRIAGLLHDVGKIGVPENVLRRPEGLEPAERAIIERHVEIGELLIRDVPYAKSVREAVGAHHERWDGNGYPKGLRGADIPLGGRILAVADTFSAVTSRRPYRDARSRAEARTILLEARGSQLDPELVDVLLETLADNGKEAESKHGGSLAGALSPTV